MLKSIMPGEKRNSRFNCRPTQQHQRDSPRRAAAWASRACVCSRGRFPRESYKMWPVYVYIVYMDRWRWATSGVEEVRCLKCEVDFNVENV